MPPPLDPNSLSPARRVKVYIAKPSDGTTATKIAVYW